METMVSLDEYKAVYGGREPLVPDGGDGLGDGGCNIIRKDTGGVIGRWSSWEMASRALNRLQKLGSGFEYRLEESHTWVDGKDSSRTCTACNLIRRPPGALTSRLDM